MWGGMGKLVGRSMAFDRGVLFVARFCGFLGPVEVVAMSSSVTRLSPLGIGCLTNSCGGDQDVILSGFWGG